MTAGRRRLLTALIVLGIPVALLALEGALRLAGFGYSSRFYRFTEHAGQQVVRDDPSFVNRFFPPTLTRYPSSFRLPAVKSDRAYRVFLFGGSVAEGDPEPSFSLTRVLGAMLREAWPDIEFEMVNAGITATNSHVAVSVAQDCAELEPDLFVTLLGHNEVVGPFGPATVFSPYTQSRTMIRASIAMRGTKVGQLAESMIGGMNSSARTPAEWRGIGMFADYEIAWGDPRLEKTYEFFEQNLLDIYEAGHRAGARVVLLTAPSNVRDFPPFRSQHPDTFTEERQTAFETEIAQGDGRLAENDLPGAVAAYERALELDAGHAETHYRLGWLYLQQGRSDEARRLLLRARDLDGLRFRADSRVNGVIRDLSERDLPGLDVVDAMALLGAGAPGGVPGNEVFYEQVHLNFRGVHRLAAAVFETVSADLAARRLVPPGARRTPLPPAAVADRLAFTRWEQYRIDRGMIQRFSVAPFTEQSIQPRRMHEYRTRVDTEQAMFENDGARRTTIEGYERALSRDPDDWIIERNLGIVLTEWEDTDGAVNHLERVDRAMPDNKETLFALCKLYRGADHLDEAEDAYERLRRIMPYFPEIDYHLGEIRLARGDYGRARAHFARNLERYPGSRKTRQALAEAYRKLGDDTKARQVLEELSE